MSDEAQSISSIKQSLEAKLAQGREDLLRAQQNDRDRQKGEDRERIQGTLRKLPKLVRKLTTFGFNPDDLMSCPSFPQKPFDLPQAAPFLKAVKKGQEKKVREYLQIEPRLALCFDWSWGTGLHWAVKRKLNKMISLLLEAKSDVDAEDVLGRTPLWYAFDLDNIEAAGMLLKRGAMFPKGLSLKRLSHLKVFFPLQKAARLIVQSNILRCLVRFPWNRVSLAKETREKVMQIFLQVEREKEEEEKKVIRR